LRVFFKNVEQPAWPVGRVERDVGILYEAATDDVPHFDTERRDFHDGLCPRDPMPIGKSCLKALQDPLSDADRYRLWGGPNRLQGLGQVS
jgi:hypothetical protein